jgi:hypothetical protein
MDCMAVIDWGEVTALATVGLVFAASAAAVYAKRDIAAHLRTSADDLHATREATRAAQEAAQRQLQESHRPLLIEVPPHGPPDENDRLVAQNRVRLSFPGGHEAEADPRGVHVALSGPRINVAVPLRNVGNGLAVIHPAQVQLLGQRTVKQPLGEWLTVVERPRVPPGESTRILHAPTINPTEIAEYPWTLTMRVPYWDFAGELGSVAIIYLEQAYRDEPWSLLWIRHEPLKPPATDAKGPTTDESGSAPDG